MLESAHIRAAKSPQPALTELAQVSLENVMAADHRRSGGLALAALLAAFAAAPAFAQGVPLPAKRPATTTGPIMPRAAAPAESMAQAQTQTQAPSPASNPFSALLGKSAASGL